MDKRPNNLLECRGYKLSWRTRYELAIFMVAMTLMMSFSYIGFVVVPPISFATVPVLVVCTAMLLGPFEATAVALVFGFASMWQASVSGTSAGDLVFAPDMSGDPFGSVVLALGARAGFALIAALLFWLYFRMRPKHVYLGSALICLVSVFMHSVLVYAAMQMFFPALGVEAVDALYKLPSVNHLVQYSFYVLVVLLVCALFSTKKVSNVFRTLDYNAHGSVAAEHFGLFIMLAVSLLGVFGAQLNMMSRLGMVYKIEEIDLPAEVVGGVYAVFWQFFAAVAGIIAGVFIIVSWFRRYYANMRDMERSKVEGELRDAYEAAEAASKAKSTFLFNISHDIRTPMNAIVGFAELAKKSVDDPKKSVEYLQKVEDSSAYMLRLLGDVLDMARIESGKLSIENEPMNILGGADSLKAVLVPEAKAKGVELHVENKGIEHWAVYGDSVRLNQVAMNLLTNAIKYTKPGGCVRCELSELPSKREGWGQYRLVVADTGIGMTEEFLEHIFDAFERERSVDSTTIQGTGLGMSIVKRLVDAIGGEIKIESEPDVGTTVTIDVALECADENAVKIGAAEAPADFDFTGKKILLVEDNALNREIAVALLRSRGMEVDHAENGAIGVSKIADSAAGTYDMVLMDIQMPLMDGYEASRAIRMLDDKARANIPIIAMTANVFAEDRRKATLAGMDAHVAKPIDVENLFSTMAGVFLSGSYRIDVVALEKFRDKYEALGCPCGYFVYDAVGEGRITSVDEATINMLGCKTYDEFIELTGGTFRGLVHPEDVDAAEKAIETQQNAFEENLDYISYRFIRKDGEVREGVDIGCKAFDGKKLVYCVYIADVTDLQT